MIASVLDFQVADGFGRMAKTRNGSRRFSFYQAERKHILSCGNRGAGKSTIIERLFSRNRLPVILKWNLERGRYA